MTDHNFTYTNNVIFVVINTWVYLRTDVQQSRVVESISRFSDVRHLSFICIWWHWDYWDWQKWNPTLWHLEADDIKKEWINKNALFVLSFTMMINRVTLTCSKTVSNQVSLPLADIYLVGTRCIFIYVCIDTYVIDVTLNDGR